MNKKLFTLLTSAALMASMAPSVFAAEDMEFSILPTKDAEAKVEGKLVYDVTVKAAKSITGLQWYFTSNGALGTNDDYKKSDNATDGFHPYKAGVDELFADEGSLTYTPELHKKPGFADKATEADNYQVAGAATGAEVGDPSEGIKIGTLTVTPAADGDTWVGVNVGKSKATYTDDTGAVAKFNWIVVTGEETTDSSEAPVEESSTAPVESSEAPAESSSEAPAESSSEAPAESSSEAPASSEGGAASSEGGAASSDAGTGGDANNNVDTGVASTAVVALAAASAALVVVSKKRK